MEPSPRAVYQQGTSVLRPSRNASRLVQASSSRSVARSTTTRPAMRSSRRVAAHDTHHQERHAVLRGNARERLRRHGGDDHARGDSPNSVATSSCPSGSDSRAPWPAASRTKQHSASATARPPSLTSWAERSTPRLRRLGKQRVQALLGVEVEPRRPARDAAVHDLQVLAAAEVVAGRAEQVDRVALGAERAAQHLRRVLEQADHADDRRRDRWRCRRSRCRARRCRR